MTSTKSLQDEFIKKLENVEKLFSELTINPAVLGIDFSSPESSFDIIWCLKLKDMNAIGSTSTQSQKHIHMGKGMADAFPYLNNYIYLEDELNSHSDFKRKFQLNVPLIIPKNHYEDLVGKPHKNTNEFINATTNIVMSPKGLEMSLMRYDSPEFLEIRKQLNEGDYLIFLKKYQKYEYVVLGLKEKQSKIPDEIQGVKIYPQSYTEITKEILEPAFEYQEILDFVTQYPNSIYYGAPGTGKSYKVDQICSSLAIKQDNLFRVTFHPEYDYSDFIGSYKPAVIKGKTSIRRGRSREKSQNNITYEFIPGPFIDAYVKAHKDKENITILVIEEINRGNCSSIFGDIFQLLDRGHNGHSKYPIKANKELKDYLADRLGESHFELVIPNNLIILATMNTSDQSLFPMDSAFKRRWNWQYVPIDYKDADKFNIKINGKIYSWGTFIKKVNEKVTQITESDDKQLGNRFVNTSNMDIDEDIFINKVLFYLWNDIYKNEDTTDSRYIFKYVEEHSHDEKTFRFNDLYTEDRFKIIRGFFLYNNILDRFAEYKEVFINSSDEQEIEKIISSGYLIPNSLFNIEDKYKKEIINKIIENKEKGGLSTEEDINKFIKSIYCDYLSEQLYKLQTKEELSEILTNFLQYDLCDDISEINSNEIEKIAEAIESNKIEKDDDKDIVGIQDIISYLYPEQDESKEDSEEDNDLSDNSEEETPANIEEEDPSEKEESSDVEGDQK
ncbi:hypothetical protein CIB95_08875 [Lottiidibacillus patelloidae]|uniref:ATPase dynein-related AAA domain-containing protein n=1 Tax=Lottiidibacillus patelloidae TaxID=2670334 RepID=A0A263BT38_9BACI|nr:AAA family ATPase [Lottiidibacillus patelloidae]OZM56874.1 hypothetical protein CIB95_08875 [Lottiidibacillus patelloidae]